MPHKCVHCYKIYNDTSQEILNGCSNCGSKFFFYIREEKLKEMLKNREFDDELTKSEKSQIEQDIRDIAGISDEEIPVFLDFESIKVIKPGKYILDIANLFAKKRPLIYQLEDGKYIIDLAAKMKFNEVEKAA